MLSKSDINHLLLSKVYNNKSPGLSGKGSVFVLIYPQNLQRQAHPAYLEYPLL